MEPSTNPTSPSEIDPRSAEDAGWLVRTSVFNPYLVIVMCLFIAVIGYVSLGRVAVDILPAYETPAVQIVTLYPGMPTEMMDRTITNRIERWTSQAMGIERQESRTMIGVSVVRDYFKEGTDPNAAFAQVSSLAMSDLYYLPPGTVPPMAMLYDPTAPLPTAYVAASSEVLNETQVYELAYFNVRNMLSGSPGVIAPAVFGGKLRRIFAYLDPDDLTAYGISPVAVHDAMKKGSPMVPPGTLKKGDQEFLVALNNMPEKPTELNDVPIRTDRNSHDAVGRQVAIRDVGKVEDTNAIQTNMVRVSRGPSWKAQQTVIVPVFRRPGSNTIEVVNGVKKNIPTFLEQLPKRKDAQGNDLEDSGLDMDVVADQSIFVRDAVNNLLWEGALGAVLASLMVLLFIGSFRSTVVIVLTIPLSALAAVIGLYFTGHTLNLMTLGGLALVLGRLVDDPIVDIENTFRHLDMGKSPKQAAIDSAREIAMPVLVATITTVAVFFPVVFLYGMGRYLFEPLALSVTFAMFASYLLSRTLSPAYCAYFLKPHRPLTPAPLPPGERAEEITPLAPEGETDRGEGEKRFWLFRVCDTGFDRLRAAYTRGLRGAVRARWVVVGGALVLFVASFGLYPLVGQELFPATDAGQFSINVRVPAGTRIEVTRDRFISHIEEVIKREIREQDRQMIVSDLGVLFDWPAGYTANAGPMDATVLVQLTEPHQRRTTSQEYANRLRQALAAEPGLEKVQFAFNTGGMISAALNFGLAAPINIQVRGAKLDKQFEIAQKIRDLIKQVPNTVDVRIQQPIDYPTVEITLDRKKMADLGITMEDAAKNILTFTNGSSSYDAAFYLDFVSGNHIYMGAAIREALITWQNVLLIPITGKDPSLPPVQLQNIISNVNWNKKTPVEIGHNKLARVMDIYVNVEGRDVGSVAADIEEALSNWGKRKKTEGSVSAWSVPDTPGYTVEMRGEVSSMKESFESLGRGFILAAVLIYLIMVAQFRSFLDPFIIMIAVPLGLIGVLATLVLTDTALNVQSFMGVIFMVGIAVSNSILLVEFANRLRTERGLSAWDAAVEAASVRLRPILMTSLAAIAGLLPLALKSGEATTPLARAVIGGLSVSTALTIFVVPCLYGIFKGRETASGATEGPDSA